jgi:hypothetical protein
MVLGWPLRVVHDFDLFASLLLVFRIRIVPAPYKVNLNARAEPVAISVGAVELEGT